jgi:hypothetical protein
LFEEIVRCARELRAQRPGIEREEVRRILADQFRIDLEEALNVAFAGPVVVVVDLDQEPPPEVPAETHARPRPAGATRRRQPALAY